MGESADVFKQNVQVPCGDTGSQAGDVRGDDDVLHLPQWVARGQGFGFENVESGTGDFTGFERDREVSEIDSCAPADVDEVTGRLHLLKLRPAKHLLRLRGVGSGNDDEIALRQQVG